MKLSRVKGGVGLCVLTCAIALQTSAGPAAAGDGAGNKGVRTLTVTKECGTATLAPGELGYCTVLESNLRALRGAKIRYFGPGFFTPDHPFLDSWVVIESDRGEGGTAFGHCLVRGVPDVLGACQFTGGSGSLRGFKADVTVTTVGGGIWHWNGSLSSGD
ncbi:MAG TPA: hypothetical protein VIY56_10365 [Vicinamibacterales bacterium]